MNSGSSNNFLKVAIIALIATSPPSFLFCPTQPTFTTSNTKLCSDIPDKTQTDHLKSLLMDVSETYWCRLHLLDPGNNIHNL